MNMKQLDIVLLPVPFSDQQSRKVRPAIVISNNRLNKTDDLLLIPLTSVLKDDIYSVSITQKDLVKGNLIRPSRARIDKIFVAHKKLAKMVIGTIKPNILPKIKNAFIKVIQER